MALSGIATGVRNSQADAIVDAIDTGSSAANGKLRVYTSGHSTLLAELDFANPAFGAAAAGVATANSITAESSAPATGTAAVLRVVDRDDATVFDGTVGTSGEDYNLNTVSITTGDQVSCTSMTMTAPAA